MNLAFSTHWPKHMPKHMAGQLTRFPEKIWASIAPMLKDKEYYKWYKEDGIIDLNMGNTFDNSFFSDYKPKIHTIRRDDSNRWKKGYDIHFWINMRKPNQFQFAPLIPVKSVQTIEIVKGLKREKHAFVKVGNKLLNETEIYQLTLNDGFDTPEDFFAWFNEDYKGKIIHWTDFKY